MVDLAFDPLAGGRRLVAGERIPGFKRPELARAASLKAGLHVPASFSGDQAAALERIFPGADDFQVHRASVAMFPQNAQITQKINFPATIGLLLRVARSGLTAAAVADVHMLDAPNHGAEGLHWILASPVDMAWVHIEAECRRADRG